ncbi:MAG: TonB-dependent receptor [Novosphingobium sp.]
MRASIKAHRGVRAVAAVVALLAASEHAHAQRANENAVTNAEDAFGTSVGTESTGIYSENDARGFSPKKAGNVRIDGVYFDQVSSISGRLRESTAIRVGFASEDYPFHAPTGIVDIKFRPMPSELGTSLAIHRTGFWGSIGEWDLRLPLIMGHVALTGGVAYANMQQTDGVQSLSWGMSIRPIFRFGGVEVSPFLHKGYFPEGTPQPLAVISGDALPKLPPVRRYLGETWANARFDNITKGATVKAAIAGGLSLRGGLFYSGGARLASYGDIFLIQPGSDQARHVFIADPVQDVHSTSGEVQLAYHFSTGNWQHRLIAGYRARDRYTESGGSSFHDFGLDRFGAVSTAVQPVYKFTPVDAGRVKQSSLLLGYTGKVEGLGTLNLGLQKARYRATARDGLTGASTGSRDDPWLYNASLGVDASPQLSFYIGTEKGLEDSGTAPESAANSNEQLPSTRSTQYEGGVRWKFPGGQLVVSAFQITKPYFSFDSANNYVQLGTVRHRGVETSLSGHFGERLSLLAGAVLMQPRVSGPGVDSGLLGDRPVGTPSIYARLDANYRTDIFGGLTPTASVTYTGSRAAGSKPQATLGGRQLSVPGYATVDLGVRQQFKIGSVPVSFRFVLQNAFDAATWKVVAANTLSIEERRRFTLSLAADF